MHLLSMNAFWALETRLFRRGSVKRFQTLCKILKKPPHHELFFSYTSVRPHVSRGKERKGEKIRKKWVKKMVLFIIGWELFIVDPVLFGGAVL